jgi:hypothetical protein
MEGMHTLGGNQLKYNYQFFYCHMLCLKYMFFIYKNCVCLPHVCFTINST